MRCLLKVCSRSSGRLASWLDWDTSCVMKRAAASISSFIVSIESLCLSTQKNRLNKTQKKTGIQPCVCVLGANDWRYFNNWVTILELRFYCFNTRPWFLRTIKGRENRKNVQMCGESLRLNSNYYYYPRCSTHTTSFHQTQEKGCQRTQGWHPLVNVAENHRTMALVVSSFFELRLETFAMSFQNDAIFVFFF